MKRHYFLIANLVLAATIHAGPKTERSSDAEAFARLKTLVGEWEGDTGMGKAHLSYELIAGGTALVERETAEKMPAMLTVYHLDGDRLVHCQDFQAFLFDPDVPLVDLVVLDRHSPGAVVIRFGQFVDRLVNHLLDHGAHRQNVVMQIVEFARKVLRH